MTEESIPMLLKKFVDGVSKASGAASAMVHEYNSPYFLPLRDKLSSIRDKSIKIAIQASGVTVRNVNK